MIAKKISKYILFLCFVGSLIFSGCQNQVLPVTNTITEIPIPGKETKISIRPSLPAPTSISPTLTVAPVLTTISQKCLKVLDNLPENSLAEGGAILWGKAISTNSYLYNFENNKRSTIYARNFQYYKVPSVAVSPDQTKIAYFQSDTGQLVISDVNNQIVTRLPIKTASYLAWLNDQHLLLVTNLWSEVKPQPAEIINISTGEITIVQMNFPDIFWMPQLMPELPVVFNSQFTRALYPVRRDKNDNLVLWSLGDEKAVIEFNNITDFGKNPQWTTDGKQAIITNDPNKKMQYDLFSIQIDGSITQLTSLSKSNNLKSVFITEFSVSPDGQNIAFWFTTAAGYVYQDFHLGIFNFQTRQVTDYCQLDSTGDNNREIGFNFKPIWSADSSKLLVMSRLSHDELTNNETTSGVDRDVKLFLVDLKRGYASFIAKDVYPIGWLNKP